MVLPVDNAQSALQAVGSYDLVEKIAEGGMGSVYRGRHRSTGQVVAVKVMSQHMLSNQVFLKRFEQEYYAARNLDHPNIVKALDFGREDGTPYLVMEFVEGESLGQRLERDHHLSEGDAIGIMTQVAQGLHKAHVHGMIHRDVKPDNILLTPDGRAKLTDLGLVKERDADQNLTRTGRGLGTPHFMAPEQFRNAKRVDVRSDIYSLAATLYMTVTGELPFNANGPLETWMKKVNNEIAAPRQVLPEISDRLDWAIRRALSPEPALRPASCLEFVEDLTGRRTKWLSDTDFVPEESERWRLEHADASGQPRVIEGTTELLRQQLRDGTLGHLEAIRVAPIGGRPLEPLRSYPEFRDLVVQPGDAIVTPRPEPGTVKVTATPVSTPPVPSPARVPTPVEAPVPPPAPVVASGPHIDLGVTPRTLLDEAWRWLVTLAVLLGVGYVGYSYLPHLLRGRGF